MILRALLLAAILALPCLAGPHIELGPEIDLGRRELVAAQPSYARAAMATDGDTTLVVHTDGGSNGAALFGTRIGPNGQVLTPRPIVLVRRTPNDGVLPSIDPHVLWHRGHFVVFVVNSSLHLEAIRVTPAGDVLERVTLPITIDWRTQFDVATDGNEFVVVCDDTKLMRLGASLQSLETTELFKPPYQSSGMVRGVAFGDGRFAIVTAWSDRVVTQFLQDGVLSPAVEVSDANIEETGVMRVAWTGTSFVAAWTECAEDPDVCLGLWTPLTAQGRAAGPVRSLGYSHLGFSYSYRYDITLTALDADTVFFTWRDEDQKVAWGRRFRLSGAPVGPAANFGVGPLASVRTGSGALAVFDSRARLAWIESPASGILPSEIPLEPAVVAPPAEALMGVAASAREIAVVRRVYDDAVFNAEVAVATPQGAVLRTIPLGEAVDAAVASDGDQFFVLSNRWLGPVTFRALGSPTSVELSPRGYAPRLVWTGQEFLAQWKETQGNLLARLDREGRLLAMPTRVDTMDVLTMVARDGRVLVGGYDGSRISVWVLDAHGAPAGAPEKLPVLNPYGGFALASNGDTEAFAGVTASFEDLVLAVRPRHGTFVVTPTTPEPPPPSRLTNNAVAIAPTKEGFLVAFVVYGDVFPTTHVALLDGSGLAHRAFPMPAGTGGRNEFVALGGDRFLLVYTRRIDDAVYVGRPRVFARLLTITSRDAGEFPSRPRRP